MADMNVKNIGATSYLPNLHELQATGGTKPAVNTAFSTPSAPAAPSDSVILTQPAISPEKNIEAAQHVGLPAQLEEKKIKSDMPPPPPKPTFSERFSRSMKGALLTGLPMAMVGGSIGALSGMWGGPGGMLAGGLAGMALGGLGGGLLGGAIAGMDNSPYGASAWDYGFGAPPMCLGMPGIGMGIPFGMPIGMVIPMLMPFPIMGMPFGMPFGFGMPPFGIGLGLGFCGPFANAHKYSSIGGMLGTLGGGLLGMGLGYMTGGGWGAMLGSTMGALGGGMLGSSLGWQYGMSHPSFGWGGCHPWICY